MLTKVLAVVFAVAVPAVGGVAYIHSGGHCPFSCSEKAVCSPIVSAAPETPGCCETPTRTSCLSLDGPGCCNDDSEATVTPEVLTVPPRELK